VCAGCGKGDRGGVVDVGEGEGVEGGGVQGGAFEGVGGEVAFD